MNLCNNFIRRQIDFASSVVPFPPRFRIGRPGRLRVASHPKTPFNLQPPSSDEDSLQHGYYSPHPHLLSSICFFLIFSDHFRCTILPGTAHRIPRSSLQEFGLSRRPRQTLDLLSICLKCLRLDWQWHHASNP